MRHALLLSWIALAAPIAPTHSPAPHARASTQLPAQQLETRAAVPDRRVDYDVQSYRLDLRVHPEERRLEGRVAVEASVLAPSLSILELDLYAYHEVLEVSAIAPGFTEQAPPTLQDAGAALAFTRESDRLLIDLGRPWKRGEQLAVAVHYRGSPAARNNFDGFHWERTAAGEPWIGTSCQSLGAHFWWPCKASFFHPEDKPARLFVNATVPAGLYAVSNGRLSARESAGEGWETFRWRHDYPLETYAVTLNVAPYVVLEERLALAGLPRPLELRYYVLPESVEKARVQFAQVPALLEAYTTAFGPFPFPESKFGLVQTSFWGMEHSTAIAYGSSFPAWLAQNGGKDRYAGRNRWYDYILVHEVAHEWWGNSVSATDWAHFWLHEGLATYAEGVYVEHVRGRADADRWFGELRKGVPRQGRLLGKEGASSLKAYSSILYSKGALVLSTLRHEINDDEAWWRGLRAFQQEFRHGNASSADFQRVLERECGRSLEPFFSEWLGGSGYPRVAGKVRALEDRIVVELENGGTDADRFHFSLDLAWTEGEQRRTRRVQLAPGPVRVEIPCEAPPRDVALEHTGRVLARLEISVE